MTGKEYTDVLVLRPGYSMDHSPGWEWLLRWLHRRLGWNEDALISFSAAGCLACILMAPAVLLRLPEAWLAAVLAQLVAIPDLMARLTQGRPYLVSEAVLICLLLGWARDPAKPGWPKMALACGGFALSAWMHGAWYLWGLPLAACFWRVVARWNMFDSLLGGGNISRGAADGTAHRISAAGALHRRNGLPRARALVAAGRRIPTQRGGVQHVDSAGRRVSLAPRPIAGRSLTLRPAVILDDCDELDFGISGRSLLGRLGCARGDGLDGRTVR